jgi:outer membrane protein TolC
VAGCTTPPRVAGVLPVGDGAALLRRRPDIRQAERTLAASTARIGVATADLWAPRSARPACWPTR